ncbi:MAG TPA: family 43 glycosylhydrolase [Candidatus Acidoferrum sp.]|nr:family 43 glycosylhydrolase [Candidatus Acidoferrum sp.]
MSVLFFALAAYTASLAIVWANPQTIVSGTIWKDQNGMNVQGHGGNIIQVGSTYYWFGENKINETAQHDPFQSVRCYSSRDLAHWTFVSDALTRQTHGDLGSNRIVERPKVLYNALTHRYVMYLHIDNAHYGLGKVGIATSPVVAGPYEYQGSFRPLGLQSWDMNLFQDDDGKAYLLTHAGDHRLHIDELSPDYLSVTRSVAALQPDYEAPAMFKFHGSYYLFGSELTGWAANDNKYAMATKLAGPWSKWNLFAPEGSETFNSQTAYILPVRGSHGSMLMFMGDRWNASDLGASTYVWLPLSIAETNLCLGTNVWLQGYTNGWTLDAKTGTWADNGADPAGPAIPRPSLAAGKPAMADSFEPGNPPGGGNDENVTTRWCAIDGTSNHWWEVDLGHNYADLSGTETYWETSGAYQYRIEVSCDNQTWTTVANKTTNAIMTGLTEDHFSAPGRYVRITITGLPSGLWASFYEFRVFGPNDLAKSQ